MHIYFSGIGGAGIGPLARISLGAGNQVSGSDKQSSDYTENLKKSGIKNIHIGQTREQIADIHAENPIDWLVYSSAVSIEQPDHPELVFAREHGIKATKRDELLNHILTESGQKLVAVAGTHGKTTTTAMLVWLFQKLSMPLSYGVGAKMAFGEMGHFDMNAEYFVYECDEYDRNFLAFKPYLSAISGIAYDHQDIYPTEADYRQAFRKFLDQSDWKIIWQEDADKLNMLTEDHTSILSHDEEVIKTITLPGRVNRMDGWLSIQAMHKLTQIPLDTLVDHINEFPGVSRRFEKIADNLYTDYAHTPEKIAGCLELAHELSQEVVVVYEPLTNKRQYSIRDTYKYLFDDIKKLYWVPSYLTREDPSQPVLTPQQLIKDTSNPENAEPAELNENLKETIQNHLQKGDLVVCLSGGGGGSLDEWLRQEFITGINF